MNRRNAVGGGAATTAALFGEVLRHFREQAGLTQAGLARKIPCDRSHVARVEAGTRVPQDTFVATCDRLLITGDMLMGMWLKIDWYPDVEHPDWFERRAAMDAECVALREYQTQFVPGLLQTEGYARALFATEPEDEEEIEERVRARLSRQQRFLSPGGPLYVALLEENCLQTVLGSPEVMREQCVHLLTAGQRENIRIQIVPAGRTGILRPTTSMSLITMPDGTGWIYSESLNRGHLCEDPAGYARHAQTYDVLRADALSAHESAALISEFMEGYGNHDDRVAQEQLQRKQRRELRRGSPRHPRIRRPRT